MRTSALERNSTLLWLDLLEKHGHAAEIAAQLTAKATATANNSFGTFSAEPQHQIDALRALQASMESVGELLSSVEEIIRKRLIDDAPAPCACRTQTPPATTNPTSASAVRPLSQAKANSLDVYLRGGPLESEDPAFVNAVRGWDARGGPVHAKSPPSMVVLDGLELHDAMMRNNLRLVGMHSAPQPPSGVYHSAASGVGGYNAPMHRQYAPAPSPAHANAVHRAPDVSDPRITPKRKLATLLPVTHNSSSSSHAHSEQPSYKRQHQQQQPADAGSLAAAQRAMQKQIESLHAERVLEFREGTQVGEYLIQWRGVAQPQWAARKLCGNQAKVLIDEFNRKRLSKLHRGRAKKRAVRPASTAPADASRASSSPADEDIFIVDKIVDHRLRYKKKQYLVKWDGYDSSENTWECATKLQADVADVVEAYERKLAAQREKQEQEQLRAGTDADASARSLAPRATAAADVVAPSPTARATTTPTTNAPSVVSNDSSRARASSADGDRGVDEPPKHALEHAAADSGVEIMSDGDRESGGDDVDDGERESVGTGSDHSAVDADDDVVEIDGSDLEHADNDDGKSNTIAAEEEGED